MLLFFYGGNEWDFYIGEPCSFVVFSIGTGTEGSLNLIHLYASWQMCPSEFSAFWGSELRSNHALPSWYSEEKKSKEKVGHTDGISSSPPCQPYVPLKDVSSSFPSGLRGSDCSCSVLGAPPLRLCMLSATFHPPSTFDLWPHHPLPRSLRLGDLPCVPLDVMGPCFCVPSCISETPPHLTCVCHEHTWVCVCVCVCTQTVCVVEYVCVSCDWIPACTLHRLSLTWKFFVFVFSVFFSFKWSQKIVMCHRGCLTDHT